MPRTPSPVRVPRCLVAPLVVASLLIAGLLLPACDTCSGGSNFGTVEVLGPFDATEATPVLAIGWTGGTEEGAGLPPEYFDAPWLYGPDAPLVLSVAHPADRELHVTFADLQDRVGDPRPIVFGLEFPDRSLFLDCTHPGMSDAYFLFVTLTLAADGTLESSLFEEDVSYGAL